MAELPDNVDSSGASSDGTSSDFAEFKLQIERLKLKQKLEQIVSELFDSAKTGDMGDFDLLVQLAKNASFKVSEASRTRPDVARQLALETPYWPILLSTSDKLNRDNASFVRQLGLGTLCSSPISVERTFKGDTAVRRVALTLVYVTSLLRQAWEIRLNMERLQAFLRSTDGNSSPGIVEEREIIKSLMTVSSAKGLEKGRAAMSTLGHLASILRTNPGNMNQVNHVHMMRAYALPPLAAKTKEKWFQFGMSIILLATKDDPEVSPFLRSLGNYRKSKYPKLLVAMEHGGQKPMAEVLKIQRQGRAKKTEQSNFWDGVTTKLRRVYMKIVVQQGAENK